MTATERPPVPPAGPDDEPFVEPDDPATVTYAGARRPERVRRVDAGGVGLAVYEWGDPAAPPVFLCHGGLDFAGTFHLLAPVLADAGWRVVAWDQRGHGDSDWATLYSWDADVRDALAVLDATTTRPAPVVGHSKGGGLMMQLAEAMPHRVGAIVNLDGLPSKRTPPDIPNHERTRLLAGELTGWLDHRRRSTTAERKPGTLDELARRRGKLNPRLPLGWLRYIVTVGARRDADGWRWKLDPMMRFGGFGPWRPEWSLMRMPGLAVPFLGLLGLELEEMGWGTKPDDVVAWLPPGARFEAMPQTGHFMHIERPREVGGHILEVLGAPERWPAADGPRPVRRPGPAGAPSATAGAGEEGMPARVLTHGRVRLALHELRPGEGAPLLLLHGLGERAPVAVPAEAAAWPGPVVALDFTGHGHSDIPAGGGHTAEQLMGDADTVLAALGPCTVWGRGLGAYIALLIAGARPQLVRGAVLSDGPGLSGGGTGPTTAVLAQVDPDSLAPPDPYALAELGRDVRPADYAASFARQALTLSEAATPLVVTARVRPPWLEAVVDELGVQECPTVAEALALVRSTGG